jgi:hypothetical protein
MRYAHNRQNSFAVRHWTGPPIDFQAYSQAGFFASSDTEVACFFCDLKVPGFSLGSEDPVAMHRRLRPNCSLMAGSNAGAAVVQPRQQAPAPMEVERSDQGWHF